MKKVLIGLILLLGVSASLTGEARGTTARAASFSHGTTYICAPGLRPLRFNWGGLHTSYAYVYPYGYMPQTWWIPGPGVWCLP